MKDSTAHFKTRFFSSPFGSLTKRELELKLLHYAIEHKHITPTPAEFAKELRLTLSKAHSYLTDLALREEELSDMQALELFINMLKSSEVVPSDNYLQCSIQNAKLRIWIELQLAQYNLLQGESIKRDIIKLTPNAILSILNRHNKLPSNTTIDKHFKENFKDTDWYKSLHKKDKDSNFFDWLSHLNTSAEAVKNLLQLIGN